MTRPAMHCLVDKDEPPPAPLKSWWAEAKTSSFYATCCEELKRMRRSKEHARLGLPMVVAQVDGKSARFS